MLSLNSPSLFICELDQYGLNSRALQRLCFWLCSSCLTQRVGPRKHVKRLMINWLNEWMAGEREIQLREVTRHAIGSSISSLLWSRRTLAVPSCVACVSSAQDALVITFPPHLCTSPSPRKPAFPAHISWGLSCYLTASSAHRWKGDGASQLVYFPFCKNADRRCLSLLICRMRTCTGWPRKSCPSVGSYDAGTPGCHHQARPRFIWIEFTFWHGTKFKRNQREILLPLLWSCPDAWPQKWPSWPVLHVSSGDVPAYIHLSEAWGPGPDGIMSCLFLTPKCYFLFTFSFHRCFIVFCVHISHHFG